MRILIIEDNRDILANVREYLQLKGFEVDAAEDGFQGLQMAISGAYDLIILDVMLPGLDGYQICKKLRDDTGSEVPIIMLTARDTLEDKVHGLNSGADDYLVKPFALSELSARISAILRRSGSKQSRLLRVSDLQLDLDTLLVTRSGQSIKLNPLGLQLLELLMRKSPAVVRREILETAIWGEDYPESDSLRTHIHQLRQALDKPFITPLLHTVHGIGYCLADRNDA